MKTNLPAVLVCAVAAALAVPVAHAAAVTRHELKVTLDPAKQGLSGSGTLTVLPGAGEREVELTLGPGYTLTKVVAEGASAPLRLGKPHPVARPGSDTKFTAWPVRLNKPRKGAPVAVRLGVTWEGKPPGLPENARMSREEVVDMPSGYLSQPGAFLSPDAGWYPTLDQATSEFTLEARVPKAWRVVSEGRLTGTTENDDGTRTESYDGTHPLEGIDIVAAQWTVWEQEQDGVRVAVYTLPDTPKDLASTYLTATARYIARFSQQIGPHPWPQFIVAEHILPTGYGMPSFTLLGAQVMRLPFIVGTSLGHEVLHDWWGNGVYVDRSTGNWCEGLTAYMADQAFAGEQSPGGDVEYRRQILRDYSEYVAHGGKDEPVTVFRERHDRADRALGYGKVAMIFHMLSRQVGDASFAQGMRTFFSSFTYRRASWRDIETTFAKLTGHNFDWFFRQWVDRPGAPEIGLADPPILANRAAERVLVSVRLTATPGWRLDIPVAVDGRTAGGEAWSARQALTTTDASPVANVSAPSTLQSVKAAVDPDVDVFRRLGPGELPVTLARLFAAPPDLVVVGTGRDTAVQTAERSLASQYAEGKAPIRFDREVSAADLEAAHRVWVLGLPDSTTAAAAMVSKGMPGGSTLKSGALQIAGRTAGGAGAAACVVLEHGDGAAGVLDALSASALVALGRRVPHYGKYSWLLFDGDNPVVREIAPPARTLTAALDNIP